MTTPMTSATTLSLFALLLLAVAVLAKSSSSSSSSSLSSSSLSSSSIVRVSVPSADAALLLYEELSAQRPQQTRSDDDADDADDADDLMYDEGDADDHIMRADGGAVDVRVHKRSLKRFRRAGMRYSTLLPDLERAIVRERATEYEQRRRDHQHHRLSSSSSSSSSSSPVEYDVRHRYLTLKEIYAQLASWARTRHANVEFSLDHMRDANNRPYHTHEGQPLYAHAVSSSSAAARPIVVLLCGQHAREWISPATCMYATKALLHSRKAQRILRHVDVHFVTVLNPDGYHYTHTHNRMWRKNRQPTQQGVGIDINRDWNVHWQHRSGQTAAGDRADQAPESAAIQDYLKRYRARLLGFIDVHSYGQRVLYPYAYRKRTPADEHRLHEIANSLRDGLNAKRSPYRYATERLSKFVTASGDSVDYAHRIVGSYAFAVELPDEGRHGFVLPAHHIAPTGKSFMHGLHAFVGQLSRATPPGHVIRLEAHVRADAADEVKVSWDAPRLSGTPLVDRTYDYEVRKGDVRGDDDAQQHGHDVLSSIESVHDSGYFVIVKNVRCGDMLSVRAANRNGKGMWRQTSVRCDDNIGDAAVAAAGMGAEFDEQQPLAANDDHESLDDSDADDFVRFGTARYA